MTRKILSIVSLAVVFAVLVPLSVATSASEVNCRVPFSFTAGGQTLPPGVYAISTGAGYMRVNGLRHGAFLLTIPNTERARGQARLVFLKTGDRYELNEVWMGDGNGLQVPLSKRGSVDRRASNAPVERIVILGDVAAGSR